MEVIDNNFLDNWLIIANVVRTNIECKMMLGYNQVSFFLQNKHCYFSHNVEYKIEIHIKWQRFSFLSLFFAAIYFMPVH
ncbi:hypothetical protein JHK84_050038 [Glycine max]|uniref:Uncharacterized protein n=1 Tax=Glycine max TaxID=3847 RepID=K7MRN4_SOYBN|nr:hypothetical protein JHK85_050766 [Glycine max]KAG5094450.1 hypothetical protein JHK84_050038 [Glycine max]KAH1154275.1 hypothetical protein GYH30_049789 [Glycine max]